MTSPAVVLLWTPAPSRLLRAAGSPPEMTGDTTVLRTKAAATHNADCLEHEALRGAATHSRRLQHEAAARAPIDSRSCWAPHTGLLLGSASADIVASARDTATNARCHRSWPTARPLSTSSPPARRSGARAVRKSVPTSAPPARRATLVTTGAKFGKRKPLRPTSRGTHEPVLVPAGWGQRLPVLQAARRPSELDSAPGLRVWRRRCPLRPGGPDRALQEQRWPPAARCGNSAAGAARAWPQRWSCTRARPLRDGAAGVGSPGGAVQPGCGDRPGLGARLAGGGGKSCPRRGGGRRGPRRAACASPRACRGGPCRQHSPTFANIRFDFRLAV